MCGRGTFISFFCWGEYNIESWLDRSSARDEEMGAYKGRQLTGLTPARS